MRGQHKFTTTCFRSLRSSKAEFAGNCNRDEQIVVMM
jgi:hypothetical protein